MFLHKEIDEIYAEACRCQKCSSIPAPETYARYNVPHPVPLYCLAENANPRIVFIMQSPGIAKGGAAQTGNVTVDGNFDATAKNGNLLRRETGMDSKDCFFTNSILHAGMTEDGKMRKPLRKEITNCSVFLKRILLAINPMVVVPVGGTALKALNIIEPHPYTRVMACAGNEFEWFGRIAFPVCHWSPLGLVNRGWSLQVEDFRKLRKLLNKLGVRRESSFVEEYT